MRLNLGKENIIRGRTVEGQWVLGGICRESKETFFYPVEDRTSETITALIQKWEKPGTIIHTDCFKSYCALTELGYGHFTVNQ